MGNIHRGFSVLRNLASLWKEQRLDEGQLSKLHAAELKRLIASAAATPFYGGIRQPSRGADSPEAILAGIPITERESLRAGSSAFIRNGADTKHMAESSTSGTSGVPVRIFMDADSICWRHAFELFAYLNSGILPHERLAYIHRRAVSGSRRSKLGLFRTTMLSLFDAEDRNLLALRRIRPEALLCCPSYAHQLAQANQKAASQLKLKAVLCGAERLEMGVRKDISESFSCPVFNTYGNTEFGFIATECPEEHAMHVTSRAIIEIVDERGRPAKSGDMLVTALYNHSMPLLRYRIGDRGTWGNPCPCGRGLPVLASLDGRTNEYFVLPSGRVRSASCFFNLEDAVEGVRMYQLVQESPDLFVLKFIPAAKGIDATSREKIRDIVSRACLGESVRIEFEEASHLPREDSGKFRKFLSKARVG